jgi:hypothetical protein
LTSPPACPGTVEANLAGAIVHPDMDGKIVIDAMNCVAADARSAIG